MTKKIVPFIDPKRPVCKSDNCATQASVKGLCRLHFLKSIMAKKVKTPEELELEALSEMKQRNRRRSNRLMGMDETGESEQLVDVQNRVNAIDTIDLDIEDVFETPFVSSDIKKTGTED
jgi:hypothetical protein